MINAEGQSVIFNHTNITNCKSVGAMLQQSQGITKKCVISVGQTKTGNKLCLCIFNDTSGVICNFITNKYLLKSYDQISIFYPTTQNVITSYVRYQTTALNYCQEMSSHPKLRKLRITVQLNACQDSLQSHKVV